jgi:hypothetical protein
VQRFVSLGCVKERYGNITPHAQIVNKKINSLPAIDFMLRIGYI